ncbi:sulfatase-like hydrolase/transferase [Thalassotalea fonticola]|uniref:Sulfatase-like hydrolase/transferase n=1 Tax=Thalassotalea fonticola TaxID=3065649 RepID=A0ABZ0GIF6_9GAMM|nr:sulfatase-like hydrolase/transferase [Colwelliaceae bacterium S1-1]
MNFIGTRKNNKHSDTIFSVLLSVLILALIGGCSEQNPAQEKPLNILFILTDDQAPDTVAAFGNNNINTPNLDSLANQGMRFSHVFNQGAWSGAVCLPSRQMINTGRHLYRTGLDARGMNDPKFVAKHTTFGETFKQSGYDTFQTGKWHLSMDVWRRSFTHGKAIHKNGMSRHEKGGHWDGNFTDYDGTKSGDAAFTDYKGGKHTSEVVADAAVDFLANRNDVSKPFMMYVGFLAPHDPLHAPDEYLAKYPRDKMQLPENFLKYHPFDQGDYYLRDEVLSGFPRSEKNIKAMLSKYYAMIEHTDAQIGRILAELEASGQADNTLIIYTSDHGLAMGQHGLLGKQNQYDHSVRAPFVVKGPNIPVGKTATGMFYLNSVFPTAAELAGLEIPESVDAPSIVPLINGEKDVAFDTVYGAYRHFQRMVRSQDYKLIYYPMIKRTQLFDMKADPLEIHDLSTKPEHADRIVSMMAQLEEWKVIVEDPLDLNAPQASYDAFLKLTWD